jgi:hypothetical protein
VAGGLGCGLNIARVIAIVVIIVLFSLIVVFIFIIIVVIIHFILFIVIIPFLIILPQDVPDPLLIFQSSYYEFFPLYPYHNGQ